MKLLFIGGTGLISSACSELAIAQGHELFILNRSLSRKYPLPEGSTLLQADIHADEAYLISLLDGHHFDAVVDFIAYTVDDVERGLRLFRDRTNQYVFISSASAYQKPVQNYLITEETPLENPFWEYSRNKIACESRLNRASREEGFPLTIIRPSLTYGPAQIPFCVGSWEHPWTVIDRIKRGKKVVVPGDGTSLWVMTWNEDFAMGMAGLLGNPKAVGETFQITSDEVLIWDQIYLEAYRALDIAPDIIHIPCDLIAQYWPHAHETLIGDKANSVVFDNSKIKRFVPNFTCKVDWSAGLPRALAWFESHPEYKTIDIELDSIFDSLIDSYGRAFPT